jgi:alkylation response protein AidB-like acyl-CoA dehydrogenase
LYTHFRIHRLTAERVKGARRSGAQVPGPEGSSGKLFFTQGLQLVNETVSMLLGPRLVADTGEWGTYAWAEHVLGAPGYRLAAGTDEVQRNIIGERVLGLAGEPRRDRDQPWNSVPR